MNSNHDDIFRKHVQYKSNFHVKHESKPSMFKRLAQLVSKFNIVRVCDKVKRKESVQSHTTEWQSIISDDVRNISRMRGRTKSATNFHRHSYITDTSFVEAKMPRALSIARVEEMRAQDYYEKCKNLRRAIESGFESEGKINARPMVYFEESEKFVEHNYIEMQRRHTLNPYDLYNDNFKRRKHLNDPQINLTSRAEIELKFGLKKKYKSKRAKRETRTIIEQSESKTG